MSEVKEKEIIFTRSGRYVQPCLALIVPDDLIFAGAPLSEESEFALAYSQSFEFVDTQLTKMETILTILGCLKLDTNILYDVLSHVAFPFEKKSLDWIRHLFRYLRKAMHQSQMERAKYGPCYLRIAGGE